MTKGERIKLLHAERCNAVEIGLALAMPSASVRSFIRNGYRWPHVVRRDRERAATAQAKAAAGERSGPVAGKARPASPGTHRVVAW